MKQQYINIFIALIIMFFGICTISQTWKMIDYSTIIDELKDKLNFAENKLNFAEERIFALGDGLWNKQHIYDLQFNICDNDHEHEFYAHKYILMTNSKYFENLLVDENITNITYTGISKNEFNSIMEILYSGKFKTSVLLPSLQNIMEYMNKFLILEQYVNYVDSYFTNKFMKSHNETSNIELISDIYTIACSNKLNNLRHTILKNIYDNWKIQILNEQHIANHSTLFFDYIKSLTCDDNKMSFA